MTPSTAGSTGSSDRPARGVHAYRLYKSIAKILLLITLIPAPALAQNGGKGLAGKYLGDEGIESDPQVVFVENFKEGDLNAVKTRWDELKTEPIMSMSKEAPDGSADAFSLLMAHVGGSSTGGHLYRRLLPGHDQLYLRFHVKFDPACHDIHHFVTMGGYNPPTPWPQGGAGTKPDGDERLTTGIEPMGGAWNWDFYTYWMEMHGAPGGSFWGNDFINDPNLVVDRDRWISVELMMKMNDPVSERNGEQATWIDGKIWSKDGQVISHLGEGFPKGNWIWDSFIPDPQGIPFEGFRWRKIEDLDLNFLWILLYITTAPNGHVSKVWFDNIVVAKEYIGPMNTESLWSNDKAIPAATGGSVEFTLVAGPSNANRGYIMLGGISGTSPGTLLPGGNATLPLNWDTFTNIVIANLNSPAMQNFMGNLGGTGLAAATLNSGPLPVGTVGLTLHFAYALSLPWDFASNPAGVEIVP